MMEDIRFALQYYLERMNERDDECVDEDEDNADS